MLLALLMLLSTVMLSLASCDGGNSGDGNGNGNGDGNGDGPEASSYTVSVKSEGGLLMSGISVHLYTYEDGETVELVDYSKTDEDGKVTFELDDAPAGYAVKIDSDIPDGYDVEDHYPLVGSKLDIVVESKLIKSAIPSGKVLKVGDIMYDFEVTKSDGTTYKLSEALKYSDMAVINFWYDGCSWCEVEFPFMDSVVNEDAYKDLVSLIALSPMDTLQAIEVYKNSFGLSIDMAADSDAKISGAFNVGGDEGYGFPTTVVIDRYGMVALIEVGAITNERGFRILFDYFTGDDYVQKKVSNLADITPVQKPNVSMPSSDAIADAFEKESLGITYRNDKDDELSWPFVITEKNGETCLKPSNAKVEGSYAQLFATVELKAGEVIAFDYLASTEQGADCLYVLVDKKDIYKISGVGSDWSTCYGFVALEDASYELAFCYIKDGDTSEGEDTVYIKNLRKVTETDIESPTYIYRFAATKPNAANVYQEYASVVLGADGYYHVGTADGPILLADLMGYTRFSSKNSVYQLCIGKNYEAALTNYCNYASNSEIGGLCPVNEELKSLLMQLVDEEYDKGNPTDNTWLQICCYYDAYGTDEELSDPIKGLSTHSAYDTILNPEGAGADEFPNSVTYNRVIMPRGLFFKFTPTESGVYQITSKSEYEVNAWIFREGDIGERYAWITYDSVDRMNPDYTNCYMIAYLEAGTEYFIDIAYYDVYQYGTIKFRVDRLGAEGVYRFSAASPGVFTYYENTSSSSINKIIAGGIDVVLGEDGYYREKRTDDVEGSLLYADFTKTTSIFGNSTLKDMAEKTRAFDFTLDEDGNTAVGGTDCTERVKQIIATKLIKVGYNEQLGETIEEGDERIGCIIVDEELAEILQSLMDKYTFAGVDASWRKLCYYHEYFNSVTPGN